MGEPIARAHRTHTVAVRLSASELAAWRRAADADGRAQLGRWARERVAASLAQPATAPAVASASDSPELDSLRAELARVGNNLNQAVRLAHRVAKTDEAAAVAVLEEAAPVVRRVAEVLELIASEAQ